MPTGLTEVRDSVLPRDDGVLLVRLLRRRTEGTPQVTGEVRHELRLGRFDAASVSWASDTDAAAATLEGHDRRRTLELRGGRQEVRDGAQLNSLAVGARTWTALVVGVDALPVSTAMRDAVPAATGRRAGTLTVARQRPAPTDSTPTKGPSMSDIYDVIVLAAGSTGTNVAWYARTTG